MVGLAFHSALALTPILATPASAAPRESDPFFLGAFAREQRGALAARPGPRLIVVLVADQFRDDFLDRFRPAFAAKGFRRLEAEGARFTDCTIPYVQTLTAPGHATLLTGTTPSVHGIVGNGWYEAREGRDVAAEEDATTRAVGGTQQRGGSPARLRAETVGDVLRSLTRGAAKVIGISDKARSACLTAGPHGTAAYWLDESSGLMQSSTYYLSTLPAWADSANATRRPAAQSLEWKPLLPPEAYAQTLVPEGAPSFPHPLSLKAARGDTLALLTLSPYALTNLFDFARRAVEGEEMGADDVPDLLALSVSVNDRVGHVFGPDSPEVLDIAARLDRELADFLEFLDRRVGSGRYAIVFTSDHGVATTPSLARLFEAAAGDSIGPLADSRIHDWAEDTLNRSFPALGAKRPRGWTASIGEGNVWLDRRALAEAGIPVADAARILADSARVSPWFRDGFVSQDLSRAAAGSSLAQQVARGTFPGRSGDVILVSNPFGFFGSGPTLRGDHGSPYRYDVHVPLLLFGWGVRRGVYREPVSTLDIAPTVSLLLGIEEPAQCDGGPLIQGLDLPVSHGGRAR